jgi:hypothetical protein
VGLFANLAVHTNQAGFYKADQSNPTIGNHMHSKPTWTLSHRVVGCHNICVSTAVIQYNPNVPNKSQH